MSARRGDAFHGLTLDLDDTLWPVWPAIERAEAALHHWLSGNATATARRFDVAALRALRVAVADEHPQWADDFTRMRLASLERALAAAGDDVALAVPAFEVFIAARNRVELFDDVLPGLAALSARWPIVAVTNGNADLGRIGLQHHFAGIVSAREFGVGKPDARIFHEACRVLGTEPHQVLHIGDDLALDVAGALGAGLRSAWIRRDPAPEALFSAAPRPDCVARDLGELLRWLEDREDVSRAPA